MQDGPHKNEEYCKKKKRKTQRKKKYSYLFLQNPIVLRDYNFSEIIFLQFTHSYFH